MTEGAIAKTGAPSATRAALTSSSRHSSNSAGLASAQAGAARATITAVMKKATIRTAKLRAARGSAKPGVESLTKTSLPSGLCLLAART